MQQDRGEWWDQLSGDACASPTDCAALLLFGRERESGREVGDQQVLIPMPEGRHCQYCRPFRLSGCFPDHAAVSVHACSCAAAIGKVPKSSLPTVSRIQASRGSMA